MPSSRILSSMALGLASIALTRAQDAPVPVTIAETAPTVCSCSPTVFTFVLSLDQTCEDNDIELNSGIDGSFCFTEEGVTVPEPPMPESAEEEPEEAAVEMCGFCAAGLEFGDLSVTDPNSGLSATCQEIADIAMATEAGTSECIFFATAQPLCCPGSLLPEPVRRRQRRTQHKNVHRMPTEVQNVATGDFVARSLQEVVADPVTEIVSAQFLEFDTSGDLTVINQDDTYADVSLMSGDRIKFFSASSFLDTNMTLAEQMSSPALVPGGASIILYGKTASGNVVRNRFFWMYDMNCGRENEPIKVDDEIGWVTVAELSNAWPTFCPALPAGSPTISPRTNEPTLTPSESPTKRPSVSPVMSMKTTVPPVAGPTTPAFGKSGKTAKTYKPGKASKSVKSSKSKSAKSSKSSKSHKSSADGHHVDGKTGKEHAEGAYANERVSKFDAEQINGAVGGVNRWYGAGMVSLVAIFLSSRQ